MVRFKIAVLIPAYNEAGSIANVLHQFDSHYTVFVVDDGSTDATAKEARGAGADVISHSINRGYEAALDTGFDEIFNKRNFDFLITFDADGQHDYNTIADIESRFNDNYDIVVAKRDSFQRFSEYLFSFYFLFTQNIKDPLSGFKGYSKVLYQKQGYFGQNNTVGTEILKFASKQGFRITTVNTHTKKRIGQSRFGSGLSANLKLIKSLINVMRC